MIKWQVKEQINQHNSLTENLTDQGSAGVEANTVGPQQRQQETEDQNLQGFRPESY